MAKAAVAVSSAVFGTASSAGLGAVYGAVVTPVVGFTPHQNPDHTQVKDTRT